ncbi:tail fiber protein [Mesorhizobium ciceri]|uniref:phage tail protein n=1 Tax=Mesorhizobium TaxID=68287 RepID=UPI0007A944E3|nr:MULTISPECIES: tail fiber protein [Mesorhizobium]AMY03078.1 phage tail protein [Mesorhizobium ciceri biovar biserrulae]RUZ00536.1 phage tail protein [Mesorhizobium sp. M7A.F.Ca.CA.001.12.2.1]RUZ20719.1 phage tail protein [Mesorhizobium sp. M7A.F.Ca.US.007.01.2.1]RUZ46765.1 phage tail protein [Mesorhizobium sp. M7A.F.Ca.US.003.02.1.1]RUZ60338.1 phage tail protein [Mesorhizobium sp. M7A.F.Ca.US.007.01.1.1]
MAEPYLSEIKLISFNFPPQGWAFCDGQFLPINQNQALFALLGTTYGGNGQTNFALPDLRGRVPTHTGGQGHLLGERGGEQAHTLTLLEIPQHFHSASATSASGDLFVATGNVLAASPAQLYAPGTSNLTALTPSSVTAMGGSQPHDNMQPYLVLNFCIALVGIFPSRN